MLTSYYDGQHSKLYQFKILDLLPPNHIVYECNLCEEEFIGGLKSGIYTLVDGHIYRDKDAIKIRYDLIHDPNIPHVSQNEVFNYYSNIFETQDGEKVDSRSPIDSHGGHRFGYFLSESHKFKPRKLILVPYLHERKIYLNPIKLNTKYFYTSIDTSIKDIKQYQTRIA